MLKVKSIHAPQSPDDGLRILASRFRGRGIPKDRCDVWMANLGPSEDLLKKWKSGDLTWSGYEREYRRELFESPGMDKHSATIKNHGQKFTLRLLKELARRQNVTLMCVCPEDEKHCHRHILKKLLKSRLI